MDSDELSSFDTFNDERPRYTIVVGVDYGAASNEAMRQATVVATGNPRAEIHLVHCLPAREARSSHLRELAEELPLERAKLSRFADTHSGHARIGGVHVRVGAAAAELLQVAADLDADVIVVGGERQAGIQRIFGAKVADRLVHGARCPVLVASRKDFTATDRTPAIEPPCTACVEVRFETKGDTWWCARHAVHHVHGHAYHYSRQFALAEHDAEVVPTGVAMGRR